MPLASDKLDVICTSVSCVPLAGGGGVYGKINW